MLAKHWSRHQANSLAHPAGLSTENFLGSNSTAAYCRKHRTATIHCSNDCDFCRSPPIILMNSSWCGLPDFAGKCALESRLRLRTDFQRLSNSERSASAQAFWPRNSSVAGANYEWSYAKQELQFLIRLILPALRQNGYASTS